MSNFFKTYDGMGVHAVRTDCDSEGNSLTLGIETTQDYVTDEHGEFVLDESGERVTGNEATRVVRSIGGLAIKAGEAATATGDGDGNDIVSTYATKSELAAAVGNVEAALDAIINGTQEEGNG